MAIQKGYSEKFREIDQLTKDQYVTASPVREKQVAADTVAHVYVYAVGTDTVEAASTVQILNLTAHAAKIGDVIRFTSGALDTQEVRVLDVATNTVTLAEKLSVDPSTMTIQILRQKCPVVNADGSPIAGSVSINSEYDEDSAFADEDTGLFILSVRQDSLASSTTTDGDYSAIKCNAKGEIYIKDADNAALLTAIDADTSNIAVDSAVIAADTTSIDGKITACNTGAVTISAALPAGSNNIGDVDIASSVLPTGAATAANQATAVASLAVIESDTSSIDGKITACNTGAVTISAELPAGTQNIGDVDVATIAAGTNIVGKVYISDGTEDLLVNADGSINVVSAAAGIDVVDFLDSGVVDSSSTNIPAAGLSIVASLAANVTKLQIIEDIGEFMTLTDGADAVIAYLPLGGGIVEVEIASGTALKLASVSGATIISGKIAINFLG